MHLEIFDIPSNSIKKSVKFCHANHSTPFSTHYIKKYGFILLNKIKSKSPEYLTLYDKNLNKVEGGGLTDIAYHMLAEVKNASGSYPDIKGSLNKSLEFIFEEELVVVCNSV